MKEIFGLVKIALVILLLLAVVYFFFDGSFEDFGYWATDILKTIFGWIWKAIKFIGEWIGNTKFFEWIFGL